MRLACYFAWSLAAFQPKCIEQRIVFVRIAMGPAVHRDSSNITRRIETAWTQCAGNLIPNIALHRFECGGVEFHAAKGVLLPRRKPGMARRFHHVNDNRLLRLLGALVATDADRQIEIQS